jgi:hypothetical protein
MARQRRCLVNLFFAARPVREIYLLPRMTVREVLAIPLPHLD